MNIDKLSLFDLMDVVADALRGDSSYCPADDQVVFRHLQRKKLPDLAREQFQILYEEWCDRYGGKCDIHRRKAVADIMAYAEEQAKKNGPAPPFRCACGAATKDPFDPAWSKVHQPHCQAAGEERSRASERRNSDDR